MTDEKRERCPFCLGSMMTDVTTLYEGSIAAHTACIDEFLKEMAKAARETGEDPERLFALFDIVASKDTDPTWGYRALRYLRGEDETDE